MRPRAGLVALVAVAALCLGGPGGVASAKRSRKKPPRAGRRAPKPGKPEKKPTKPAAPALVKVKVVAQEFKFTPNRIEVPAGATLALTLVNGGTVTHNLAIAAAGQQTTTIRPGEAATVRFRPPRAGSYAFACKVPGHEMVGMKGVIVVAPPR